jgi:hypothetical protein
MTFVRATSGLATNRTGSTERSNMQEEVFEKAYAFMTTNSIWLANMLRQPRP